MLTLRQIAVRTTNDRKVRSGYVKVLQMKTGHTKEGLGFVAGKTYSRYRVKSDGSLERNTNPNHYVSVILFIDKALHCKVSCSCDDNLFRHEYANTQNGASDIEYSNGDPALVTNPNNNPGLCKHLFALFSQIKNRLPPPKR